MLIAKLNQVTKRDTQSDHYNTHAPAKNHNPELRKSKS